MKKLFLMMAAAAFVFAACNKPDDPTPGPGPDKPDEPDEPEYVQPIKLDGNFDDWAALGSKAVSAKSDPNSPWDAVKEIRVYSDEFYVFYYLEYDNAQIGSILEEVTGLDSDGNPIGLPIRLNLNTDGEFESGYAPLKYSLDGYDFIIEGSLAEEKAWKSFDGTLHQRIDGGWVALQEGGLCEGAGNGNKYEIALSKDMFNGAASKSTVPMLMGDEFQTGVRFYTPTWGELANMPDGAVTDDNANGYGHLLKITTDK